MASAILHEALHQRQAKTGKIESRVLMDSETQALSNQLCIELSQKGNQDPIYAKNHEVNLQKWKEVVNKKRQKPNWAPKLEYMPNLSKDEKLQANTAYIYQMAAVTTRAQYIKDFVRPASEWKKERLASPHPSYNTLSTAFAYKQIDQKIGNKVTSSKIMRDDIAFRNPGVTERDLNKTFNAQLDQTESENAAINSVKLKQQFENIRKSNLPSYKKIQYFFKITQKAQITPTEKMKHMSWCIFKDQKLNSKPNPQRTKMIKELRKITGNPQLPVVQNEPLKSATDSSNSTLRSHLKHAQENPYSESENTISADRYLKQTQNQIT